MKSIESLSFRLFLLIISFNGYAQINIDYPLERSVVQRDNENNATVYINGNYTKLVDQVEARLVPINGGKDTGWQMIQIHPTGGFFSGKLVASGGWYRLEVRGIKDGNEIGSARVERVGIGEVFIIAGQSNAQGFHNFGAAGASDDRVNCVNTNNNTAFTKNGLDYPSFSHLDANSNIAPRGQSSWAWGKLGDQLTARLGVPILFFNVAFEGTLVGSWRQSITSTAYSPYVPLPYEPSGMPFVNLRWVMQYYVPMTGLRAVLWEQGEADNLFANNPSFSIGTATYADDLKSIIDANRNESGKNVSWMVALTSYDNTRGVNNSIREGQKQVIKNTSNVFEGPDTDVIQIPRNNTLNAGDGVHFYGSGLSQLANAWFNKLDDAFFGNSLPQTAQGVLRVDVACTGNNAVRLAMDVIGHNSFSWSNGQGGDNITVGNGSYRASARDEHGNLLFSPLININQEIVPQKPTISLEGSNPVCLGNSATLVSSISDNISWNTGSTSQRLAVTASGGYTITSNSIYGCQNTSNSYAVSVINSPLPAKPTVTAAGVTTFCEGGEVELQAQVEGQARWSNGANVATIKVNTTGNFTVRALDAAGCYSPESDAVTVKVNSLPSKPQIALNGNRIFCEGEKLDLTSNYASGNIWSNGSTATTISVTTTGTYTLKQKDGNGCEAVSDIIEAKVNPLPPSPTINALRPTSFCERDYTLLQSSQAHIYIWSNGSNNPEISTKESGEFTVSAKDANGCISKPSAVTKVTKNPLPARPIITALGSTTFCENLFVEIQATEATGYLWSNGEATRTVKINNAGLFSVRSFNEFQCYSDPSNNISTSTLSLPNPPQIESLGATTFCEGGEVTLLANNADVYWNNGLQGSQIKVTNTGDYTATTLNSQGCYSHHSNVLNVDVKPKPATPMINKEGVYTLYAENSLASGMYIWEYNGTAISSNTNSIKAVKSGSYQVKNTLKYDNLICSSDFSESYNFNIGSNPKEIVVYPNPVSIDKITIEALTDLLNVTVQIIDINGRVQKNVIVDNFDTQQYIDIKSLPSGVYFVKIMAKGLKETQRIVVAH